METMKREQESLSDNYADRSNCSTQLIGHWIERDQQSDQSSSETTVRIIKNDIQARLE